MITEKCMLFSVAAICLRFGFIIIFCLISKSITIQASKRQHSDVLTESWVEEISTSRKETDFSENLANLMFSVDIIKISIAYHMELAKIRKLESVSSMFKFLCITQNKWFITV